MSMDSFLVAMDDALKKNCSKHLDWKPDEIRPLFRSWVRRELEFTATMFYLRRKRK